MNETAMNTETDEMVEQKYQLQDGAKPPIRIAGICGSLQPNGTTKMALSIALKGASEYDVSTNLVELRDYELDFYGKAGGEANSPDVARLRSEITKSQGIIIGSPEYHGSLSGVLKNMFDLMSIEDFETKIIGLVGVAGGQIGAINSLNTMKTICRNLHSWVLPQEVSIANSGQAFNSEGNAVDPALEDRLRNVGRQVVKFATVQRKVQHDEFMDMWKSLPTW